MSFRRVTAKHENAGLAAVVGQEESNDGPIRQLFGRVSGRPEARNAEGVGLNPALSVQPRFYQLSACTPQDRAAWLGGKQNTRQP
jgi:hypothetical protein